MCSFVFASESRGLRLLPRCLPRRPLPPPPRDGRPLFLSHALLLLAAWLITRGAFFSVFCPGLCLALASRSFAPPHFTDLPLYPPSPPSPNDRRLPSLLIRTSARPCSSSRPPLPSAGCCSTSWARSRTSSPRRPRSSPSSAKALPAPPPSLRGPGVVRLARALRVRVIVPVNTFLTRTTI